MQHSRNRRTNRHASIISASTNNSYVCTICDYKTHVPFNLQYHMISSHKVVHEDIYKCQSCNASFVTLRSLNIHQATCSNFNTKVIPEDSLPADDNNLTNFEKAEIKFTNNRKRALNESLRIGDEGLATIKNNRVSQERKLDSPRSFVTPVFVCSKCTEIFASQSDYKLHEENDNCSPVDKQHSIKKLKINGLDIKLPTVHVQLLAKRRSHHPPNQAKQPPLPQDFEQLNQCHICQKTFACRRSLVRHIREIHAKAVSCKCPICQKTLTASRHLKRHIQEVHKTFGLFNCGRCEKTFNFKKSLRRHIREVHEGNTKEFPDLLSCGICKKFFGRQESLRRHIREVHEKHFDVSCHICHKVFSSRNHLERHVTEVHEETIYNCSICQNPFKSKRNLERHIREVHEKGRVFTCYICQSKFRAKRHYQRHMKNVHEIFQFETNRNSCKKTFGLQGNIERLQKEVHEESIYNCSICQKTFKSKRNLERHIMEVHEKGRVFTCYICQSKFRAKRHYQRHMKNVHEIFQFETNRNSCKKIFGLQRNIEHLQKEVHEETIYNCSICQKPFKSKSNLERHISEVHGKNLFNCHICHKKICSKRHLRRHMKNIHKIFQFDPPNLEGGKTFFGLQSNLDRLQNNNADSLDIDDEDRPDIDDEDRPDIDDEDRPDIDDEDRPDIDDEDRPDIDDEDRPDIDDEDRPDIDDEDRPDIDDEDRPDIDDEDRPDIDDEDRPDVDDEDKPDIDEEYKPDVDGEDGIGFNCHICHKTLSSRSNLQRHVAEVHKEAIYNCSICQNRFRSRGNLKRHVAEVHGETIYNCSICQNPFRSRGGLRRHVTEVHEETIYNCSICQNPFRSRSNLKRHISEVHERNFVFTCHICHKKLSSKTNFRRHMKNTHKIFQFEPPKPDNCKTFGSQREQPFKEDDEDSADIDDQDGIEFNCHKTESTQKVIQRHEKHETLESLSCNICHRHYARKSNLIFHVETVHRHSQSFTCHICKKNFKAKKYLKSHLKDVHENSRSFNCTLCQKQYSFKRSLDAHTKFMHPNIVPLECHICHAKFWSQRHLEGHIRYKHQVPFKTNNNLSRNKSHSVIHKLHSYKNTTTLRYQCFNCNYGTNRQRLFANHEKLCCNSNKESKCDETNTTLNLNQENRQINQIKEIGDCNTKKIAIQSFFSCTECNYKTPAPYNLRRHMLLIHKIVAEGIYKCQLCGESYENYHSVSVHQKSCTAAIPKTESGIKFPFANNDSKDSIITDQNLQSNKIQNLEKSQNIGSRRKGLERIRIISNDEVTLMSTELSGQTFNCPVFVCSICSDIFANSNDYKIHSENGKCAPLEKQPGTTGKKINGLQIKLPQVCLKRCAIDSLPRRSTSPWSLHKKQPENEISSTNGEMQCQFCQKVFVAKRHLIHHINIIHSRLSLNCHLCDKIFKTKKYLDNHVKFVHESRGLFECKICHCKFNWKNNLVAHINNVHKNHQSPKSPLCPICNKVFSWKSNLTVHMLQMHTDVRRFQCNNCNYKTNRKCRFTSHIKHCAKKLKGKDKNCNNSVQQIIPLDVKKLDCRCSICGILCSSIPKLLRHMETHYEPGVSGLSCENEATSSKSAKLSKVCTQKMETTTLTLGSKPPAKNNRVTRQSDKRGNVGKEICETKTPQNTTDYKEEPNDSRPQCETVGSLETVPESDRSETPIKQEGFKNELVEVDICPPVESIKYEFTSNLDEKRNALARALEFLYKKPISEDLSQYQCKLCHLTCLDALALDGHMKRHLI